MYVSTATPIPVMAPCVVISTSTTESFRCGRAFATCSWRPCPRSGAQPGAMQLDGHRLVPATVPGQGLWEFICVNLSGGRYVSNLPLRMTRDHDASDNRWLFRLVARAARTGRARRGAHLSRTDARRASVALLATSAG